MCLAKAGGTRKWWNGNAARSAKARDGGAAAGQTRRPQTALTRCTDCVHVLGVLCGLVVWKY